MYILMLAIGFLAGSILGMMIMYFQLREIDQDSALNSRVTRLEDKIEELQGEMVARANRNDFMASAPILEYDDDLDFPNQITRR